MQSRSKCQASAGEDYDLTNPTFWKLQAQSENYARFFTDYMSVNDFAAAEGSASMPTCELNYFKDHTYAETYLNATNDAAGVETVDGKLRFKCVSPPPANLRLLPQHLQESQE